MGMESLTRAGTLPFPQEKGLRQGSLRGGPMILRVWSCPFHIMGWCGGEGSAVKAEL